MYRPVLIGTIISVCIGLGITYSLLFEIKHPEFQKAAWEINTEVEMEKLEEIEKEIRKSLE